MHKAMPTGAMSWTRLRLINECEDQQRSQEGVASALYYYCKLTRVTSLSLEFVAALSRRFSFPKAYHSALHRDRKRRKSWEPELFSMVVWLTSDGGKGVGITEPKPEAGRML